MAGRLAAVVAPDVLDIQSYEALQPFRERMRREAASWPDQVASGIRRIAVSGIQDPLTDVCVPPDQLRVSGPNLRETIEVNGCNSRQRAQLLILKRLMAAGELPPYEQMRCYLSEAITPYADFLKQRMSQLRCSEYLPEPEHWLRGKVAHRDIRNIGLPPGCLHLALCNEIFEHCEELPRALAGLADVLTIGGYLLATLPLAYGQVESIVKARWRGEDQEPELLCEPEWHGDPVNPQLGSLVYQIPGWELLEQLKSAGFREACLHAVSSTTYGVLGEELPIVFVVSAKR